MSIFISYSSNDKEVAHKFVKQLASWRSLDAATA